MQKGFKYFLLLLIFCGSNIFALGRFDSIEANGPFNITLTGGPQHIYIAQDQLQYVNAVVVDNTLMLNIATDPKTKKPYHCLPINLTIQTPYLHELSLMGETTVKINNITTAGLSLVLADSSTVSLNGSGAYNIRNIEARGDSRVKVQWVNSDHLSITGEDYAQIELAGTAKLLEVRMADRSFLEAKYLRPQVAFVQTADQAGAEVLATQSLYTFASGDSNIYYFKKPDHFLESSSYSGDILQLGHWR